MLRMNGACYTYVKNLQGDIVGIVDSTGALLVEYKYDAWGNPISTRTLTTSYDALAELNPFRYRGYVWDEENQYFYLNSRYYSPILLRFINADIVLNDESKVSYRSLFSYCRNNPANKVDIHGYRAMNLLDAGPGCMYNVEEALGQGGGYTGSGASGGIITGIGTAIVGLLDYFINSKSKTKTNIDTDVKTKRKNSAEYYVAFANNNNRPIIIGAPMDLTSARIFAQSYAPVDAFSTYVRSLGGNTDKTIAYGIYTIHSDDAEKLARSLSSGNKTRMDSGNGEKLPHFHAVSVYYSHLHFWFEY